MKNRYLERPLKEIHNLLVEGSITPIDLVEEALTRIAENTDLNAFITVNSEEARKEAEKLSTIPVEKDNLLFGIPIAIKDNIVTKNLRTTCASKMLENFIPPYDATVIKKLKEKHMIIVGKLNMDEFAMGSTSQTSYFGAPKNPWDKTRIAGGSSGGSASCVAAGIVPFALGSDTGGSIRQPSSYCGLVGMKPTYGRVSRYGLIAFASSLDQIGPMTKHVYENAVLLNAICGMDPHDLTSSSKPVEDFTSEIGKSIQGKKVAIPKYYMSDIVSLEIREKINEIVSLLEKNGVIVTLVDIPYLENAVTLYEIIAMGEASSNLARFDGIRYGYRTKEFSNLEEMYRKTRAEGFGDEVKRRIMVGSYLLSGENAKIYYDKALSVRSAMKRELEKVLETYDFIIGPTTTTTAYHLGEGMDDPMKSFLDDILVIPVNMAGLPGMNLPIGFDSNHMPIGLHIIASPFAEAKIYGFASAIEKELNLNLTVDRKEEK